MFWQSIIKNENGACYTQKVISLTANDMQLTSYSTYFSCVMFSTHRPIEREKKNNRKRVPVQRNRTPSAMRYCCIRVFHTREHSMGNQWRNEGTLAIWKSSRCRQAGVRVHRHYKARIPSSALQQTANWKLISQINYQTFWRRNQYISSKLMCTKLSNKLSTGDGIRKGNLKSIVCGNS